VGIVTVLGGVLDVCGGDGDTTLSLFRSLVDSTIIEERCEALLCLPFCDGSCEGSLKEPSQYATRTRNGGRRRKRIGEALPFRDQRDQSYLKPVSACRLGRVEQC